jgi:SAM-dependent methyltransferase
MGFMDTILLALTRDRRGGGGGGHGDEAMQVFDQEWPEMARHVEGKRVLDFGCGRGHLAVGLARRGAVVTAVDIQARLLEKARRLAGDLPICFAETVPSDQRFDIVVSINAMEHYSDPLGVLRTMRSHLVTRGRILMTFCPTWLAPYGAHMHFFTRVPWVHLIFPEDVVMRARSRFMNDGATRYEEVEGGLNRMTVRRFREVVRESGLRFDSLRIDYVKGQSWASGVPLLRELLSNRVTTVLRAAEGDPIGRRSLHGVGWPVLARHDPRACGRRGLEPLVRRPYRLWAVSSRSHSAGQDVRSGKCRSPRHQTTLHAEVPPGDEVQRRGKAQVHPEEGVV